MKQKVTDGLIIDCFAGGGGVSFGTEREAAEAWNRRAGEKNER